MTPQLIDTSIHRLFTLTRCAAAGFARAESVEPAVDAAFHAWLQKGNHAGMGYLERHASLRVHPRSILPDVRTVISVAFRFPKPQGGSLPVAAYALGRNYHKAIKSRLKPLCAFLEDACGAHTRICVDSAPIPERYWACRAGIAMPARNGAVMVPGCGPYAFLCEVLTDAELYHLPPFFATDAPMPHCTDCNECVKACPSGALKADGTVDCRRCLSYLSIEHKGALPDGITLRPGTRFPLLGCDRCLAACPLADPPQLAPVIPDLLPRPDLMELTPERVLALADNELESLTAGTSLRRAGADGLRRNAARAIAVNESEPEGV